MPFINFAELKASIPIEDAARALRLKLTPDGDGFRSPCPSCKSNQRAIKITPGKGFYCHSGGQEASGSVIDLVKHVRGYRTLGEAAQFLMEEFGTVDSTVQNSNSTVCNKRATVPPEQKREPTRHTKRETEFDPEAFRKKLKFTDEVAALGFSEDDAERFDIGFYRGMVYVPVRHPNGSIRASSAATPRRAS